jgi:hypothetical protein
MVGSLAIHWELFLVMATTVSWLLQLPTIFTFSEALAHPQMATWELRCSTMLSVKTAGKVIFAWDGKLKIKKRKMAITLFMCGLEKSSLA